MRIKLKIIEDKINISETIYFDEDLNLIDEFSPISSLPGEKNINFQLKVTHLLPELEQLAWA